jgi:hypothetical protein
MGNIVYRSLFLFGLLVLAAPPAVAFTLYVPGDYATIQAAIDASAPGDEIVIAAGTYSVAAEHEIPHGDLIFRADGEVVLTGSEGGFFTVLAHPGADQNVRFEGFRFEGNEIGIQTSPHSPPFYDLSIEVVDCVFESNSDFGIDMPYGPALSIVSCRFEGGRNSVYMIYARLDMRDCVFSNLATAAIRFEDHSSGYQRTIENCLFLDCDTAISANWYSQIVMRHCTIDGTGLPGHGAIRLTVAAEATLENCIVTNGPGMALECQEHYPPSQIFVSCSDIWNNAEGDWSDCAVGGPDENGNFSADPLFCDPAGGDYTIDGSSPCAPPNNDCGELVGALPVGCGVTSVSNPPEFEFSNWSRVKSLY